MLPKDKTSADNNDVSVVQRITKQQENNNERPQTPKEELTENTFMDPKEFLLIQLCGSYGVLLTAICFSSTLYFTLTAKTEAAVFFYETPNNKDTRLLVLGGIIKCVMIFVYAAGLIIIIWLLCYIRICSSTAVFSECTVQEARNNNAYSVVVGEGFNMYLKAGLIMFCLFSIVYNLVRMVAVIQTRMENCGGTGFVVLCALQALYMLFQTAYIVKHDKIVFMKRINLMRACLTHMFVTNLCSWIHASVGEISEGIVSFESHRKSNETEDSHACKKGEELVGLFRPYLLPAVIEYSLLGAPMILEMLIRVGEPLEKPHHPQINHHPKFHKSKRGIITGILGILLCLAAVVAFYLVENKSAHAALLIFHIEGIMFGILALVISLVVYLKMSKLRMIRCRHFFIDRILLWISLFGTIMYYVIAIKVSAEGLLFSQNIDSDTVIIILDLLMALVTIVGSIFQTIVILSGMHRIPTDGSHVNDKPGRPYITFLLCVNLALWIIETFQVKKTTVLYKSKRDATLEGTVTVAILHIVLPLCILFRFHSTVCLSSVWWTAFASRH